MNRCVTVIIIVIFSHMIRGHYHSYLYIYIYYHFANFFSFSKLQKNIFQDSKSPVRRTGNQIQAVHSKLFLIIKKANENIRLNDNWRSRGNRKEFELYEIRRFGKKKYFFFFSVIFGQYRNPAFNYSFFFFFLYTWNNIFKY